MQFLKESLNDFQRNPCFFFERAANGTLEVIPEEYQTNFRKKLPVGHQKEFLEVIRKEFLKEPKKELLMKLREEILEEIPVTSKGISKESWK